ncbi:CapA family protein [Planococcus sp. APC 3906]|uniref:CapA family protein n=1 Tax=Planococcus sp. APC 3906 TaxID=3035194 RepID=UPI0025B37F89|nr:CapA family protein [Planococcus sp. APC 3906]MDN3450476.1 CapA family protein [Planococcus sp. APC 3906]
MSRCRIFITALMVSGLALTGCAPEQAAVLEISNSNFGTRTAPSNIIPAELSQTRTASISAIGDVLIHGTVYTDAQTADGYDFNPMFEKVAPFLSQSDITVANSESIIGGSEIGVSTYPSFNSPYEVGDAMKNAGIDIVSMANNHTLDRGVKAIENAVTYWQSIGIKHTGSHLSAAQEAEVTTITKNGITFSFLSFTYGTNGVLTPAGKDYLVKRIDKEAIQRDLAKARTQSDVVVLSLHFGIEYENMPNAEQIDLAHFSADNGADIIIGHHPHVLQPAEWIETSDGRKAFAVYSLGNFLSGQDVLERKIGGILHLEVEKTENADSKTITLKEPAFTPTFVRNTNLQNFEVDLLKNVDANLNNAAKKHMSVWVPEMKFIE